MRNEEDLDDLFARILERSRSHRTRPTVEDEDTTVTDPHGCIQTLPGSDEFPLWRIGCRVR